MKRREIPLTTSRKKKLYQWGIIIAIFVAGQVLVGLKIVSPFIFASPINSLIGLYGDLVEVSFYKHLQTTLIEIGVAFGIALILGLFLGFLFWKVRKIGQAVEPLLLAVYSIPMILFYPVLLVVLGLGEKPVITIATVLGVMPIILNTRTGLASVSEVFIDYAKTVKATWVQTCFKVILPAAFPTIFTGIKLGLIYALVGVVAAEFLASAKGLGFILSQSYFEFTVNKMYGEIVMLIVIAVLTNVILGRIERRIYVKHGIEILR